MMVILRMTSHSNKQVDHMMEHRFIRALCRQPVDKTPVWLMRQAGRYLPEYRKIREQAGSFMAMCQNPELACEVTLQPLARFPLDAAIIFSDILTIPNAMGLGLHFVDGEGPQFKTPIRDIKQISNLTIPDMNELRYVFDAIALTTKSLNGKTPLIGFAGSPWTVATYMVEGGSSKNFAIIKKMLFSEPEALSQLLEVLAQTTIGYLNEQIQAGAEAVMVFDTWGGVLTERDYLNFSLKYMNKIVEGVNSKPKKKKIPIILFTKQGGPWLEKIANTGCDAVGLDWTINIEDAKTRVGHQVALQGNMDPCLLYAPIERIRKEVAKILTDFGDGPGHVFNLGHGIHPEIPPEHVGEMVKAVHELSVS